MTKRLVLDTNLHVSLLISRPGSMVRDTLDHAYRKHLLYQSPETLAEVEDVFARPKFDRYMSPEDRRDIMRAIRENSELVDHNITVDPALSPDPKDLKFFALAEAVNAHYIVSGDKKDVLSKTRHGNTQTIGARDFISRLSLGFDHMASPTIRQNGLIVPIAS